MTRLQRTNAYLLGFRRLTKEERRKCDRMVNREGQITSYCRECDGKYPRPSWYGVRPECGWFCEPCVIKAVNDCRQLGLN